MNPWEKYAQEEAGPWAKYSDSEPPRKTLTQAVFPRASEAQNMGTRVIGGALDLASLPGRFAASGGMGPTGPNIQEMARIEGNGFIDNMARDPAAIPTMALGGPALKGAEALGLTGLKALGAMGAAEGLTSAGIHQTDRAIQGKPVQPGMAALEAAGSAVLPVAPGIINKGIGRLASGLSGPSEEALRTYGLGFGKGAQKLAENAGKQNEIGLNLVDAIDNAHDFMPEAAVVDDALKKMPPVNISKTIQLYQDAIDKLKKPTAGASPLPEEKAAIKALQEDMNSLRGSGTRFPKTNYAAEGVRELRKRIDATASFGDDKAQGIVNKIRLQARTQLKNDLVDAANASGNPEYEQAMKTWSDKLDKVDQIKALLGKSGATREQRAESFISNLYGKNKTERRRLVGELGDVFGQDFLQSAKLAKLAAELGPEGVPGWLPTQNTGRASLGAGAGIGAAGYFHNPYLMIPAALSSPRVSAGVLGSLDALQTIPGTPVRAGLRSIGQRN